ncbi:MAG: LrgB family protein [Methylovirgula sp.]|uniref:LrgB family protein n=1 Tax=Methylovirgula sp. TaxID=1978224 RepID=UPI003075F1A2
MYREILDVWTPLAPSPLVWIVLTIGAYLGGCWLQRRVGGAAYANPVLFAVVVVGLVVLATGTSYSTYFGGAQFINFLLGPATVALAVPLARNFHHIRRNLASIGVALAAGSVTAIISGIFIVHMLGGSRATALSMAPKSVTTPIAMAVSTEIGGDPALTAALAMVGGILAAIVGEKMLKGLRVADWRAHGLAAGVAGSGVAAAQAASLDGLAAAFAALGIALNGLMTALILPLVPLVWH